MARPLRIQFPGAQYHVMHRGIDRKSIFYMENDHIHFLQVLDEVIQTTNIQVYCYCLMNNHYHLLIHTPEANLNKAMQLLNSRYAQYINKTMKMDGPVFRGRYHAILIESPEYLLRVCAYIHLNPIKHGFVTSLEHYRWSSYHAYLGHFCDLKFLHLHDILLNYTKHIFNKNYLDYLGSEEHTSLSEEFNHKNVVFGEPKLDQKVKEDIEAQLLSHEIPNCTYKMLHPSIDEIIRLVMRYYQTNQDAILKSGAPKANKLKDITMWLCKDAGNISLINIANYFGCNHYSSVCHAIKRAKTNPELKRDFDTIWGQILKIENTLNQ